MRWRPRLATLTLTLGALGALFGGQIPSIALVVVGLALLRHVPGWWRAIRYGALGGLVAGILVLGPGLRLAMRVVAVLDPARRPQFTLDGTMFILVIIGALIGLIFGILGSLTRTGWSMNPTRAWVVPAFLVMLLLIAAEETRTELFTLGAGPWVNIPMFTGVAVAYGWGVMAVVTRLESRREAKRVSVDRLGVPA